VRTAHSASANNKVDLTPPEQGDGAIRRQSLFGSSVENTYAGVLSFMRRKYSRSIAGADLVVSGVPLDLATTFRPGARLGPNAVRAASAQLGELLPYPWGEDIFKDYAVVDFGDCYFDAHNPMTVHNRIVDHARHILASGAQMLTFGGDHYVTYPLLMAHYEKYKTPISLIHFDAHCDTWPDASKDSLNHGTMFYKAVHDGIVDPKRSVQVGIRTWNDDFMGFNIRDAAWVHSNGIERTVADVKAIVQQRPTYVTFDIDCLDPAFAPGTGTPVPGGLTSHQALSIIRSLVGINIIGADVVEVSPPFDHSEITALSAAHIACDLLCVMRQKRLAERGAK